MYDHSPHLETAIAALKASRDAIRDNRSFEPADLSSLVATVRETAWNLEAVVTELAAAYGRQSNVGHDNGDDPQAAIDMITLRLGDIGQHFAGMDDAFGHAHDLAAKLHSTEQR